MTFVRTSLVGVPEQLVLLVGRCLGVVATSVEVTVAVASGRTSQQGHLVGFVADGCKLSSSSDYFYYSVW